jgi:hypothetical protein
VIDGRAEHGRLLRHDARGRPGVEGVQPTCESLVSLLGEAVALPGKGVDDDHLDRT